MARLLYPSLQQPILTDAQRPEQVTESRWHQPWSEPRRYRILPALIVALAASGCTWSGFTPAEEITVDKWFSHLSEPVRQKSGLQARLQTHLAYSYFTQETVNPDKWYAPLNEPVRAKASLRLGNQQFFSTDTDPIVSFGWMSELSLPPKAKISVRTASQEFFFYDPYPFVEEIITLDKWWQALAEPVRQKSGLKSQLQSTVADVAFNEGTTFESKWHQPWSEPVRFRRGLYAYQQPFATASNVFPLEVIFEDKWHFPWSEPVRQKLGLPARLQQSLAWDTLPDDSLTGTMESRWHQPWSEPVRQKKGIGSRFQTDLAWGYFTPEATSVDKWFAWLNEPVRSRRAIGTASQQVSVTDTDPIVSFGWFNGLAEPPKPKVTIKLGSQQFFATDTDPIVSFSWFATLTEPVRQKVGLPARLQQFLAWDVLPDDSITGTMESRWHQPWSEPVRFRRFQTAQQQDLAWEPVFVSEVVYEDKWHFPWSEPVRIKRGLAAHEQQSAAFAPTPPLVSFSYYNWLSEPKRFKRGLPVHEQPTTAFNSQPVVSFGYYGWLTEPVRLKKGLQARLQMPVAEPPARPNLPDLRFYWHQAFSEPVREKKGLWARLQQFFTFGTPPIAGPAVTVVLDATETNADTAEFYAVVYNRPVRANVSIKEIPRADSAYASIEET